MPEKSIQLLDEFGYQPWGSIRKHPVNLKIQIPIVKLLLAFALAGLLLLCAIYSTLAYYRLVSIAKGI